jgi:hypothetical protein
MKSPARMRFFISPKWVMALQMRTVTIAEANPPRGEETEMLEWRPRLIALLALVVLVALSLGFGLPVVENWEW